LVVSSEAKETFAAELAAFKEHLAATDHNTLFADIDKTFRRAKTTKCEHMMLKALSTATKTKEAKHKAFVRAKDELQSCAKLDATEWVIQGLLAAGDEVDPANEGKRDKKKAKKEKAEKKEKSAKKSKD
jgi:hypothetical protein